MALTRSYPFKEKIALYTALAFHVSGFIAIGLFKSNLFINLTWLNLLICLALIIYTQRQLNSWFWIFVALAFGIGFTTEYIGIHTGLIFGNYAYGEVFGPGINGVPYLIGVQWLVSMYCIGVSTTALRSYLQHRHSQAANAFGKWFLVLSTIADGAMLAVLFDWVLEPVAVHLGYWNWQDGIIPIKNYITWYVVSFVILTGFHFLPFKKQNIFAIHLLLIQFMFFLALRVLL